TARGGSRRSAWFRSVWPSEHLRYGGAVVTALAFAAATWGTGSDVSAGLRIRKIVQHRSSHGVSIGYMGVLFVGFLLWLSYGIALGNWAIIVPNVVAAVVIVATMAIAHHYRRP